MNWKILLIYAVFAWSIFFISKRAHAQEFLFTYNLPNGQSVKYKTDADTWKQAYDRGAKFCFDFFADQKPFDEDWLVTVIDTCANPSAK